MFRPRRPKEAKVEVKPKVEAKPRAEAKPKVKVAPTTAWRDVPELLQSMAKHKENGNAYHRAAPPALHEAVQARHTATRDKT